LSGHSGGAVRPQSTRPSDGVALAFDINTGIGDLGSVLMRTPSARNLCNVDYAGRTRSRDCPPLDFQYGGHLKGIALAPGSTSESYGEIHSSIEEKGTIDNIVFDPDENSTTFVPLVSAWDVPDNPLTVNLGQDPAGSLTTPFDVLIGDTINGIHKRVRTGVRIAIVDALDGRQAWAQQPIRGGSNQPGLLRTSSLFDGLGQFDVSTYTSRTSEEFIPISLPQSNLPSRFNQLLFSPVSVLEEGVLSAVVASTLH